jgi:hypothetical protein
MKIKFFYDKGSIIKLYLIFLFCFLNVNLVSASTLFQDKTQQEESEFKEYSGTVVDNQTGKPLLFAGLSILKTNISVVTNSDGEFAIKVPEGIIGAKISISFLGYIPKILPISFFKNKNTRIKLNPSITHLAEISITLPTDAKSTVLATLSKKGENNLNERITMTAFYRETIKKRRKNVSLAEAVVKIYKEPYTSYKRDKIKLFKARKSTDYSKLDTLALKLQGGPFNALYIDLMKYPEYMFTDNVIDFYQFNFAQSTTINNKQVFVIKFNQRNDVKEPLYYGELFIDAETLALTSAVYNLNIENRDLSSKLFVKKKPRGVSVYPTRAAYHVDYRVKNGRWYYGYSRVQLTFKINRKSKWFNSVYSLSSEMAVTDWELNKNNENLKSRDRIRPSIIISDEASGFTDPKFWGAFNVIEPEKSIESAISKIKRQLKKIKRID